MLMKKRLPFLLAIFILPVTSGMVFPQGQDTVALVGGTYAIRFQELRQYVNDYHYDLMFKRWPRGFSFDTALNVMIVNQLKRIDFFELGLQKDSKLLESARRSINEGLVIEYFNREYLGKYVNDKLIHDAYEQMKRQVVFDRFLVEVSAVDSMDAVNSVNIAATRLQSELGQGKGFDDLVSDCRRWFATAKMKEDTGTVAWRQTLTSPPASAIFNLRPGDVGVLKSTNALQIVKVIKNQPLKVAPFEKVKDEIFDLLQRQNADRILYDFEKAKKGLINENRCQWNQKALDQLLAWSNIRGFYDKKLYADTLTAAISKGRNFLILNYPGGKVDVKEYLRLLNDVLILPPRPSYRVVDIKNFLLEALRTDKIVKKAAALHLEKYIFNANTADPVLKKRIVSLYDQKEIESRIPDPTEKEIREFYAARGNSLYYQPAIVGINAIILPDKDSIDVLWQKHIFGLPFEKLANSWYVKTFGKYRNDDTIRSYLSIEPPFLGNAAFKLKLNEVAGPVNYLDPDQGMQYAIIKCIENKPEKQLTLEEARSQIPGDYKNAERRRIERETVERLKKKYGFKVYRDVLMRNLSSPK
jgi:ASC-1-like (ASCH) protein